MIKKIIVAFSLLLAAAAPTSAQFADQATYAGTGAGTANAQTITLANATSYADVVGVLIKYVPAATNTGAATLNINGFGSSPAFRKPNGAGLTALTGGEIVSGQPTYVMYDGTFFDLVSPTNLPIGAAQLQNSALSFGMPVNLSITGSVGSNQLTVALKGADGNSPSATNPVLIPFRNATIANGTPTIVSLQSDLSITINSTNTMGCVSGQMCRLWVVAINNSGAAAVCLFNALSGTSVAPINEAAVQTSASGTTGGSLAQTYYCSTSAVTSKAIRILGYVEIQEVTAGTWASGPTYVQLFGPGIKKPGETVQSVRTTSNTNFTTSNTSPQATNLTAAISPTSAANTIVVTVAGTQTNTSPGSGSSAARILRGGATQVGPTITMATSGNSVSIVGADLPNSLSSQTYGVYINNSTTGYQTGWDPAAPAVSSIMILNEIMSALPEPANDDGRLTMVG